jgi:integrase
VNLQQVHRLYQTLGRRWRDHLSLMVRNGVTLGEVCGVQAADVDLARQLLSVGGRSGRVIPITDEVAALLERKLAGTDGRLFEPWPNVRRDLAKASSSAGLPVITPSVLRRAFISWLAESGIGRAVTLALLGRGSSRVVKGLYGLPTLDAMRKALAVLPPFGSEEDHDV